MADLAVDVAESFIAMGQLKQAKRWIKSALRIVKNHHRATHLRQQLAGNN